MSGRQLLAGALTVWAANVIVFALWFWELDRGGPRRREADGGDTPDFLFPQMTDAKDIMPGWQPAFSDYLYTRARMRPPSARPTRCPSPAGRSC